MDWFEALTGFPEGDYTQTRRQLEVVNGMLHSHANGKSYGIGELELVPLKTLRERVQAGPGLPGRLKVSIVRGDVRAMHSMPENTGALFQVASQFNLLEMVSPRVTPEQGVTGYQYDGTQGPACALAAGAATIYRNYFVKVGDHYGQTRKRQLDSLAGLGQALSASLSRPVESLWDMQNGYAMCSRKGLDDISSYLANLNTEETELLRGLLCIGLHSNVQVTDHPQVNPLHVSQAFCSALPVAYGSAQAPAAYWESFATFILDAAYEATLWAAVLNYKRTGSNVVLLTRLGGGVFGNGPDWIDSAMRRALRLAREFSLDVRLVSFGPPSVELLKLVEDIE